MKKFVLCLCVLTLVSLCALGCAPKEKRCALSGAVTLDGDPVPTGVVNFVPEDADPTKGSVGASVDIVDGAYAMDPKHGALLLPGKYKVQVNVSYTIDKKTKEVVDINDVKDGNVDPLSVTTVNSVPEKWGAQSEQVVDVPEQKTMTYDINMTNE